MSHADDTVSACPYHAVDKDGKALPPDHPLYRRDTDPHLTPDGQAKLSVLAMESSIPKGGTDDKWNYPSPQRFYNAMAKKGWNPQYEDVQAIVSVHNTINERAWKQVMQFEALHAE